MPEQIFLSTIRLFLLTLHSINHQFTCLLVSITLPNFYSLLSHNGRVFTARMRIFSVMKIASRKQAFQMNQKKKEEKSTTTTINQSNHFAYFACMQFVGRSDDGSKLSPNDDIRSLRFSSNRFEPFSSWLAHCLPVIESSMTTRHLPGCQYADFIIVRFELIFGRWMDLCHLWFEKSKNIQREGGPDGAHFEW